MKQRAHFSLLPVFIILAAALAIFFPVLKRWQPWTGWFAPRAQRVTTSSAVRVWVNERSGLYYCTQSVLFGKITPGQYMVQGNALQKGYRPAEEEPCH